VDLEEKAEDPIWDLAKTAEAETSIEVRHRPLLFPRVLDENGARKLSAVPYAGVKDDGAITWLDYPQRFESVTVADVERTKEDGLFQGDPHATILDLPDIGNGGIVQTWPDLLQWLFGIGGVYGGVASRDCNPTGGREAIPKEADVSSERAAALFERKGTTLLAEQARRRGPLPPLTPATGAEPRRALRGPPVGAQRPVCLSRREGGDKGEGVTILFLVLRG